MNTLDFKFFGSSVSHTLIIETSAVVISVCTSPRKGFRDGGNVNIACRRQFWQFFHGGNHGPAEEAKAVASLR